MYMRNTIFLHSEIPSRMRPVLSVKLRQVRGIVSAVVEEKKITVYYVGRLDLRALNLFIRAFEEKYGRKKEQKDDDMDVATYRREAIISGGGFIAMNILRKVNPEFYGSILLFRRLFTLYIARRYIKNVIMGLVKDHQANADTLTATAVAASVLAGKPESSLTLLALSNGAEMMTEYAAEKARRQISGLLKLDQRDVWLVENGHERKVPVESLKRGDLIAVHLGEKICVDGSVVSGNAAVNQASITGESNPAIKQEKSPVYAGSVIEAGDLVIRVEKVGADTSLAQIIHLVEEAQTRRAPVQNFADKMANLLVPISFIGAAIVYGATKDWQRVLNLLFIDFSCGLKVSTATAISAAIGVAARKGILIKGGNYLEALAKTGTVVFDKTGTLTRGSFRVTECHPVGMEEAQVVLVTTGSQGEPLSALSRMASCSHRQVRVGPGDFIIISAKPIPGNEKSVTKIVNGLLLLGAEVIYEGMYDVHVSGHACQEEQKLMLTLTRPKYFLPVHGEYKQLKKHAITAASLGIPTSNILIAENGSNIILSQDEMKLGEPVTAGAVMVDGLGVGDVGNVVLRDRKHLSEDGLVIIVATVDSKTGKVLAGPDLVSRGFVYVRENESLMDGAQSIVETALDRCVDEHVRDWNSVKTRVREALSSYIYRRTKRSPMILPILMEV